MVSLLLTFALLFAARSTPPPAGWWCSDGRVEFRVPVAALVLDPQQSLHHELPAGASATLTVVERGEDVDPELDGETVSPPPGAVILLDGSGLGAWKHFDGRDAEWKPIDAAVEVVPGARDVICDSFAHAKQCRFGA